MKSSEFGQTAEYEAVMARFTNLYEKELEEIRKAIDFEELGLNGHPFVHQDSDQNLTKKEKHLLTDVALRWSALTEEVKAWDYGQNGCRAMAECAAMKRMDFVMSLYRKHFLSVHVYGDKDEDGSTDYLSIFLNALKGYDSVFLLNDYHHILGEHANADLSGHRNCKHEAPESECGHVLFRNYRDNEQQRDEQKQFDSYLNGLDFAERNVLEISSKMHTLINHRLDDRAIQRRAERAEKDEHNKFVIEAEEKKAKKEEKGHVHELKHILRANRVSESVCNSFDATLKEEEYDTEAVLSDLVDPDNDPFNNYPQSNILPLFKHSKFTAKLVKKHLGGGHRDDQQIGTFTFGFRTFLYWRCFKGRSDYNKAKHSSLKDECLNNSIYPMPLSAFNDFLVKSYEAASFKSAERGNC